MMKIAANQMETRLERSDDAHGYFVL